MLRRLDAAGCVPGAGDSGDQQGAGADADRGGTGAGGRAAAKGKQKMRGGEAIEIEGERIQRRARYSGRHSAGHSLRGQVPAVVNKPAGMMVHAGAGASDDARNRGTLVNALLFHMAKLSEAGGELRPGIVHRLDKQTSGAIVVAKDDATHRRLGEMFATRRVAKTYIALLHGRWRRRT